MTINYNYKTNIPHFHLLLCLFSIVLLSLTTALVHSSPLKPSDADSLLAFKSKADLNNHLTYYSPKTSFRHCKWPGVQCGQQGRVVRLILENLDLGGVVAPDTLTRLDQLRVLSLQNNSLTGPIPDLSPLFNLKTLFLDHNSFSGSFPPSITSLHRLRTIDLSANNLTGPIPTSLVHLDRLYYLRLEWNHFNGSAPPLNQSSLRTFNVSGNKLVGAVPVTAAFLRFGLSSFSWNPGLCGEILNTECHPAPPFFSPSTSVPAKPPTASVLSQSARQHGGGARSVELTQSSRKKHKSTAVIFGFSSGALVLICSIMCFVMAVKKQRNEKKASDTPILAAEEVAAVVRMEQENELEEKVKRVQVMQVAKSGSLVFCAGEAHLYTLEQLMRGSAELLGRGAMGTTYKAVLDNRLIVSVKRLDAVKMAGTSKEMFEHHMESVGGLRHPNLVPLRAYFQAKEERLLVYDYQPNGSLDSLVRGSKSTKAKPLHWTSCLKIAEDVAQGLSYIHQAWRLVHGNLKSSNVLFGPDFEACIADYCLVALLANPTDDDADSAAYKGPEARKSGHQATTKSDVYAFGILLLELLTGRAPSQVPLAAPDEMLKWVRTAREEEEGGEDERLGMMVEVAVACSLTSPEQRPTMWQVLKMIQEIKESVLMEDSELELDPQAGIGHRME